MSRFRFKPVSAKKRRYSAFLYPFYFVVYVLESISYNFFSDKACKQLFFSQINFVKSKRIVSYSLHIWLGNINTFRRPLKRIFCLPLHKNFVRQVAVVPIRRENFPHLWMKFRNKGRVKKRASRNALTNVITFPCCVNEPWQCTVLESKYAPPLSLLLCSLQTVTLSFTDIQPQVMMSLDIDGWG